MTHPIFARYYAKRSVSEEPIQKNFRQELLEGLSGRVLEIGFGNGLNFPWYPPEVDVLYGIEPEPYLLWQAIKQPFTYHRRVLARAKAEELLSIYPTAQFDAVVFSLVLCSIPDPQAALRDAKSLLRPGGEVRVYEHTLSVDNWLQRKQRFFNPLWKSLAGGCNLNRDPIAMVRDQFKIKTYKEVHVPSPLSLVTPHVLIRATNKESHA